MAWRSSCSLPKGDVPVSELDSLVRQVTSCQALLAKLDRAALATLLARSEEGSAPDGFPTSSPGPSAAPLASSRPCRGCAGVGRVTRSRQGRVGTFLCDACEGSGREFVGAPATSGLRTDPTDPLRRHREHGYQDNTSTEDAALGRLHAACRHCEGTGRQVRQDGSTATCRSCEGTGRAWADEGLAEELGTALGILRRLDKRRQVAQHAAGGGVGRPDHLQEPCQACDRDVSGVGNDRLRRGLCRPCYLSWSSWKRGNDLARFDLDPGAQQRAFIDWRRSRLNDDESGAVGAREWREAATRPDVA